MRTLRVTGQAVIAICCLIGICGSAAAQDREKSAASTKTNTTGQLAKEKSGLQEDWATLSVRGREPAFEAPILGETDNIPGTGFIRERYRVEWRDKDPFDLYVIRPRSVEHAPVILYLYSYPEDTEQFKSNSWCESAVGGGYAAVGFVGAAVGHRLRYRFGPQQWFVSEMPEALAATVHDVQLILDYVATRKDLDSDHVGMFGTGSGGAIAILASAVDPRIKVLDLLAPWGDWPTWVTGTTILKNEERAKYGSPEFLAEVAPLEPVSWLPKVKAKALRVQDVRGNKAMPDQAQEKLEAAAPEFAVINEYGNGLALFANTKPAATLFEWMKGQLRPDAKLEASADKSERIHVYPAVQQPAMDWLNVGKPDNQKIGAATNSAKEKDKPNQN